MVDTRRVLVRLGLLGPVVAVGFTFIATVIDPQFSWRTRSLSSIGEATGKPLVAVASMDQLAFNLFNAGLFLAAVFGLPFAYLLWTEANHRIERTGVVLFAVTLLGLGGVGIAFLDGPYASLHFVTALTFFFGTTFTLWVHGTGLAKRTGGAAGLGAIWLSNAQAVVWVLWMLLEAFLFTGDGDVWTYFAVPEFVAAVAFGTWVFLQARRIRNGGAGVSAV